MLTRVRPLVRRGDDGAEDFTRARCPVMEPPVWHNLVVRLWRDGDGLKVRFLASRNGRRPAALTLATSAESAVRQFEAWLRSIDADDPPPDLATLEETATRKRRDGRRGDDAAATGRQTPDS